MRACLVAAGDEVVHADGEILGLLKARAPPPVDHLQLQDLIPAQSAPSDSRLNTGTATERVCVCRPMYVTEDANGQALILLASTALHREANLWHKQDPPAKTPGEPERGSFRELAASVIKS